MRLLLWVGVFSAGIAGAILGTLSARAGIAFVFIALGLAVISVFFHCRGRRGLQFMIAASMTALCAGVGEGAREAQCGAHRVEALGRVDTDVRVDLTGVIASAPEQDRNGYRVRLLATEIDGHAVAVTISLFVASGSLEALLPGDRVRIKTKLRSIRGTANPGVPDATLQTRASGIDLFAGVAKTSDVVTIRAPRCLYDCHPALGWTVIFAATRAACVTRRALAAGIDHEVAGSARDFLHTAVLGERRRVDPRIEDGFRAAGATHVLSVSGLHLAVVALVLFVGARRLVGAIPRLPLFVSPAAVGAAVTIPAIWFYSAVTGAAVATLRAALMMSVVLGARIVGRKSDPIVAIAAAALLLTLQSPLVIFDVSYQLSMASVLALALLIPTQAPEPPGRDGQRIRRAVRIGSRWIQKLLLASLIAGAATTPLVAHHFGEFTPAGPIGNLLLVPLVETVTVPFGLAGAALGATLGPWAGRLPLTVAAYTARLVLGIADGFRVAAPVVLTRMPNALETAALMLGTVVSIRGLTRGFRRRRTMYAVAAAAFALGLCSIGLREIARRRSPDVVVTFLDVGQGDSAVVELPGGHALLIDAGGSYDGSFDPGARIVEPFLRAHGILKLDRVVLSHPHPDHMGGLHRIVQRFAVDALWTSGDDGRNPDYRLLIAEASQRHIDTPVPARFERGEVSIEPLGPFVRASVGSSAGSSAGSSVGPSVGSASDGPGGERIGPPEGTSVNDASLVLRLSNGRRSVLFTGDLEAPGEGELRGRAELGQTVASDVLKVPHHGSRTSSTDELLDTASPRLAVMSLGWCNRFHFPRPEVVERYRHRGIRVLRTDLNGAVTVTLTPAGAMHVQCERGCDSQPDDRNVKPP